MYEIKTWDEITVGDKVSIAKTITEADSALYGAATGDFGPVHVDQGYASKTIFGQRIASGIMVGGIFTSILTSHLVGIVPVSIEDRFWFTGPVKFGDTLTIEVWIADKNADDRTIVWEASATNQDGGEVLTARATMKYPRRPPPRM